jgi:hypothetical protein
LCCYPSLRISTLPNIEQQKRANVNGTRARTLTSLHDRRDGYYRPIAHDAISPKLLVDRTSYGVPLICTIGVME